MYRLNIVSTNPTGSVQQQQQQQQAGSVQSSTTGQPAQLTLVQQPAVVQQSGGGGGAIQIIGLTSLNALTNATTITGLASSGGSSGGGSGSGSSSGTVVTAQKILKAATVANNNNSISIVKIGDEIMLKAVKVEPVPMVSDTGGGTAVSGAGAGVKGGTISATTSGGVTVTAIPVQQASVAASAPSVTSAAAGTVNGNVIYGGKRRLESNNEEWISSPSPGSVPGSAPPLSPSPGSQSHTYTTTMSNGYSSPMSTGSYDPYSPNGKMGMF